MKIYLYIKSKNALIYCNTWQNGAEVGNIENVFCVVNGSLEDVEKKMEGYHPILDSDVWEENLFHLKTGFNDIDYIVYK